MEKVLLCIGFSVLICSLTGQNRYKRGQVQGVENPLASSDLAIERVPTELPPAMDRFSWQRSPSGHLAVANLILSKAKRSRSVDAACHRFSIAALAMNSPKADKMPALTDEFGYYLILILKGTPAKIFYASITTRRLPRLRTTRQAVASWDRSNSRSNNVWPILKFFSDR